MKIRLIILGLLLFSFFLINAQEDIMWDESSVNIILPQENADNLPIIDKGFIDWETGLIIIGILLFLFIGYKIKFKKKNKK